MYLAKCKFYKFSHFPAKRHKATQVKARCCCCCCKRHDDNKTQRSDATKPKRAPELRERERHMRSLFGATLRRCRRRRWQRTWLFFFYVLRSVNEQHSGKCKAKRWAKKMCQAAQSASSARESDSEGEPKWTKHMVKERKRGRVWERESAGRRGDGHLMLCVFVCVCGKNCTKWATRSFFFLFCARCCQHFRCVAFAGRFVNKFCDWLRHSTRAEGGAGEGQSLCVCARVCVVFCATFSY